MVLKSTFLKSPPNIITYRSYKNFSNDLLRDDLNSLLSKENMTLKFTSLTSFTKIFMETLKKHAPIKKKYIRPNFVTKGLRKAIMLRSRLRSLKRLTTSNATFALKWLKKLIKATFKTLTYQKLLTTRSFGKL